MWVLTFHFILDNLESAANIIQSLSQTRFNLVEFLCDQRETTQKIIQILIQARHAASDFGDLGI